MTKRTNPTRTLPRTLDAAKLSAIGGGMNKADLTEQLAFCDDMSIELKKR